MFQDNRDLAASVDHKRSPNTAESVGAQLEPPFVTTLGSLDDVRNGYNGNNYDWSEWYYFDY